MSKDSIWNLSYKRITAHDVDSLVDWLISETWPWHGSENPSEEQVRRWIESGKYTGDANRAFWIYLADESEPIGLIGLEELDDPTPIFDLRLRLAWRGKGLGKHILTWLTEYVFTQTDKHRFEGHTRIDNVAMQKVFLACNWVKEAHYRQSWPDGHGKFYDALTFAVLKSDWESDTITPVEW